MVSTNTKNSLWYYSINFVLIVSLLGVFFGVFNPKPFKKEEPFGRCLVGSDGGIAPIPVPPPIVGGSLDQICGTGAHGENGVCKADNEQLISELVTQGYLKIDFNGNITYDPGAKEAVIKSPPDWITEWISQGNFKCRPELSMGKTTEGCTYFPRCSCTDCYGWSGGNATNCDQTPVEGIEGSGSNQNLRVWCNIERTPDECTCTDGFCPVNGLCVSPYQNTNSGSKVCCPDCITSSDSTVGCAGEFACREDVNCQNEKLVIYPGDQVVCPNSSDYIISPKCSSTPTDVNDAEECWDPNHPNDSKKQPYVYVMDSLNQVDYCEKCTDHPIGCDIDETTGKCKAGCLNTEENKYNGMNEYGCAVSCIEDGISPLECSKKCLPKLWQWYPVFADVGGKNRVFKGYMQTDKLIHYVNPDEIPPLMYCPPDTCLYQRDLGDNPRLTRCTECEECQWGCDEDRPLITSFTCSSCKKCLLDIPDDDGPLDTKTMVCNNLKPCTDCTDTRTIGGIFKISENTCNSCGIPENPAEGGCVFYTRQLFKELTAEEEATKPPGTASITMRPEAQVYNKPLGYKSYTQANGCDFIPLTPDTCDNRVNGNDGWGGIGYNWC